MLRVLYGRVHGLTPKKGTWGLKSWRLHTFQNRAIKHMKTQSVCTPYLHTYAPEPWPLYDLLQGGHVGWCSGAHSDEVNLFTVNWAGLFPCPPARWHYKQSLNASSGRMIQKICSPVHLHDGILHKALTQAVDNDSRSLFLCPPARWHYKQNFNAVIWEWIKELIPCTPARRNLTHTTLRKAAEKWYKARVGQNHN